MKRKKGKMIINVVVGFVFLAFIFTFYNTFSLEDNYKFESLVYDIDGSYIENISSNTSIELFFKYFDLENCSIEVVDKNNEKIVTGFVVNGSKTILYDNNHNVITTYTNVIKGDYNSDGIIDMNDFQGIGKCLVNSCLLDEYLVKSVDIDTDGELHINDLVLLDKAVTNGYTGISLKQDSIILQSGEQGRLVAEVKPAYGVNQNVKWVSLDESIVTVDEAGRATGHKEGETKIMATTLDGKYTDEVAIKVDNTIQLDSYEGIGYIGGNDVVVGIKSIDYEGVTCKVSNEEIASCEIQDKSLVLKAKAVGKTVITVTSTNYGEVTYSLATISVYLNVLPSRPKYICTTPGNAKLVTVSGFNTGDLSFEISDKDIISSAYMQEYQGREMLLINFGTKQGSATLKVTENHANTSNVVTVDVSKISMSDIGKVASIGQEVSTTIIGDNLGDLSCVSSDDSIGTCRIEDKKLIVTPLALGSVTINVYNKMSYDGYVFDCGYAQFMVVVRE